MPRPPWLAESSFHRHYGFAGATPRVTKKVRGGTLVGSSYGIQFRVPSTHMRRAAAIAGSILFLVIAPGTVAVLVPQRISKWQWNTAPGWTWSLRILGGALIVAGAAVLLDSFARFALRGLGTPAPVFPTKHLVVSGLYRYVRNPMYLAVTAVILGQALLLLNAALVIYGLLVWLAFHLFVIGYEEPTLRHSFGDEYAAFCADVPRWIPRLHPRYRRSVET